MGILTFISVFAKNSNVLKQTHWTFFCLPQGVRMFFSRETLEHNVKLPMQGFAFYDNFLCNLFIVYLCNKQNSNPYRNNIPPSGHRSKPSLHCITVNLQCIYMYILQILFIYTNLIETCQ